MMVNYILYIIIMQMNRQWIYGDRLCDEFITGLNDFLAVANANKKGGFVICPCAGCKNQKGYSSSREVHLHLLRHGFMPSYNCWTKHGERGVIMEEDEEGDDFIDESYLAHFGDTFMEDAEGGEGEGEGEGECRGYSSATPSVWGLGLMESCKLIRDIG